MKNSISIFVIYSILFLVLLFGSAYLGYKYSQNNIKPATTIIKRDTIVKVVERIREPIYIYTDGKIKVIKDTLYQSYPFVSSVDTIIKRDTIFCSYEFPKNKFMISLRPRPDSTIFTTISQTFTEFKEVIKQLPSKKWNIGINAGIGLNTNMNLSNMQFGYFIGVGLNYNLIELF